MVDIASRNLFQEKVRFVLSSGGVALAIMLILILNGFYVGLNNQVTAYLSNEPIDLVVAQKGLRNFVGTNSLTPLSAIPKIEKIKGVKKVVPVFASYATLDINDRKIFALLIGFKPKIGGGPWKMQKGSSNINDSEMIYDEAAAKRNHLMLGDKLSVLGKKLKIVGFSGGTSSFMTGTSFITFKTAQALRKAQGKAGFLLIETEKGSQLSTLKKEIQDKVPDFSVVNKQTMIKNDIELFAGIYSAPLRLMVGIAFLIGLLMVGLTIYTATVERSKEYGVLKALGMKNLNLYRVVIKQAAISSVFGFIIGVILSFGLVQIIEEAAPQFLILIEAPFIARLLPLAAVISFLASYMPVRYIAKIDPAIAFKRGV